MRMFNLVQIATTTFIICFQHLGWLEAIPHVIESFMLVVLANVAAAHYGGRAELVAYALNKLAEGDLTYKLKLAGKDEFSWLAHMYETARKATQKVVADIHQTAEVLSASSERLSRVSSQSRSASMTQLTSVRAAQFDVETLFQKVRLVADSTGQAANATEQTNQLAQQGGLVISELLVAIHNVNDEIDICAKAIVQLEHDSQSINGVIDVINDIAEKTNLLALNAAIEAARAGEFGRGFAVVADEVRKLSLSTSRATEKISHTIDRLQKEASHSSYVMQKGGRQLNDVVFQADEAGLSLKTITEQVGRLEQINADVDSSARDQASLVQDIRSKTTEIDQLCQQTANVSTELAGACEEMATLAENLLQTAKTFKTT